MQRIRFEEILRRLDDALAFCHALGLGANAEQSRFSDYRRNIEQLIQVISPHLVEGPWESLLSDAAERVKYETALMESLEFSDILRDIRAIDRTLLKRTMRGILNAKAPLLPSDEDSNSNEARNRLFELNLASKLVRAGLNPSLGEPDLSCEVDGKRLFIACKRPYSRSKVIPRIYNAKDQILDALEAHSSQDGSLGARGVVAISVSKVLNPGDRLFVYSNEMQGRSRLQDELRQVADDTEKVWKKLGKKIVGILFHIITPAHDRAADRLVLADQTTAHPIAREGSLDYRAFRHLVSALEAIGY
jgi:hypothetical protein